MGSTWKKIRRNLLMRKIFLLTLAVVMSFFVTQSFADLPCKHGGTPYCNSSWRVDPSNPAKFCQDTRSNQTDPNHLHANSFKYATIKGCEANKFSPISCRYWFPIAVLLKDYSVQKSCKAEVKACEYYCHDAGCESDCKGPIHTNCINDINAYRNLGACFKP